MAAWKFHPSNARCKSLLSACIGALEEVLEIAESPDTSLDLTLDTDEDESNWASNFKPVQHGRRIYINKSQRADIEHVMLLRDLYRIEGKTHEDLQNLTISKLSNRSTWLKRLATGNAFTQQLYQTIDLDLGRVALHGKADHQTIASETDRFALSRRWVQMSIYVPGTGFPAFKKQVLDRLSVLSAGPNELEMFLFSSRLRLPREAVEKFFEEKYKFIKATLEIQEPRHMKGFLQALEKILRRQAGVGRSDQGQETRRPKARRNAAVKGKTS